MTHEAVKNMLVDALYDELRPDDRAAFEEHLAGCPSCSREFAALQGVASTMSLRERQGLSTEDWKAFWNVLSSGIQAQQHSPPERRPLIRPLRDRFLSMVRLAAAAIVILAVGIGIGRYAVSPGVDASGTSAHRTSVENAALREETLGYLERSKVLLLGIVNSEEIVPEPDQLSRQQEVSRVLVSEGGDLRQRLSRSGQQQLGELVNDLEVLLLQIANLEIENDYPGLEIIRGGVDRRGILLKINVEQMKAMEQRAVPRPKSNESSSTSMI